MAKTGRFLRCMIEDGPSAGDYVIHAYAPRFMGKVHMVGDSVRVLLYDRWDAEMSQQQEQDILKKMQDWYFYKFSRGNN